MTHIIKSILLSLLVIMLFISSCKKDELTLPAKVFFEFEFIAHEGVNIKSGPSSVPVNSISVQQGKLVLRSIEFNGQRTEGKNVFFISDLRQPLEVDLKSGETSQNLSFDIPQGIYNHIEIHLELGADDMLPLVLEGRIRRGPSEDVLLRYEYDFPEKIRIRAESGKNSNSIVLRKDISSSARIIIDSELMFRFVKMSELKDASISMINGEAVILINSKTNNSIFSGMADRLEKSFRVIFD